MQDCADGADRRLDLVLSGLDALHVGQSCNQANGPVAAHSQVANIVKEDDPGGARGIDRIAEQSADYHVGASRLIHNGRAEIVVLVAKTFQPLGQRTGAEIRPATHYQAGWLAPGVGIDDPDSMAFCLLIIVRLVQFPRPKGIHKTLVEF